MKKILIPVAAVLFVAFLVWFLSPVQVVKRRTNKLMNTLTMEEGSGGTGRQFNVLALGNLIAEEITLETPDIEAANGEHGRDVINSGFSWLAGNAKFTKFEVVEFHSVVVDGDKATVSAKIEGVVVLPTYRPADGLYEVELDWKKEDDGWRLARSKWSQ